MNWAILTILVKQEQDVVSARQRARQIAGLLGFDRQTQTRIATAVSEIARNAYSYAGGGKIEFIVEGQTAPQVLLIRISDQGPGIAMLSEILAGRYHSATGMGLGILGAQRLMDRFQIDSTPGNGATVWLRKILSRTAPLLTGTRLHQIANELAQQLTEDPLVEIQRQNQELIETLNELRHRQEELVHLNRELEDTNRGVVALYAELDEKADHLRRADEMKSRFLSNMSHEFRTPLNSQLALTRLLLDRLDGNLTGEQEKQIRFIRKAAESLLELVNDFLDLAKIEAGKIEIHPVEFEVATLFSALRGMLRPLLVSDAVNLLFEEPKSIPPLNTDEGKVSQILRNFLSNALKFTEKGEVRVSATLTPDRQAVVFAVADTGIGIAPPDQQRIFEEFTQVKGPLQTRVKGTGLGLPLCARLAELLGGEVAVQSQVGVGSTFTATIPLICPAAKLSPPDHSTVVTPTTDLPSARGRIQPILTEVDATPAISHQPPARASILAIEDDEELQLVYQKRFGAAGFTVLAAHTLRDARRVLEHAQPHAIVLDILLRGEDTWRFLAALKADPATKQIPVLVVSNVDDVQKGLALGADAYCVKPLDPARLLEEVQRLLALAGPRILVIDDQEPARYLIAKLLAGKARQVIEAATGRDGLRLARIERPDLICLDLVMPEMDGWSILRQLQTDSQLCAIPVVVITSSTLSETERQQLEALNATLLTKAQLSHKTLWELVEQRLGKRYEWQS